VIIGQPKSLNEFQSLTPEEVAYLAGPILQAIQSGHPMDAPVQVDLTVLCRLLATVRTLGMQVEALTKLVPVPEAPALPIPILPLLRPGGVVSEQK
jgi:hypothetical protein